MSMNFEREMDDETIAHIKEIMGDPIANDRMTFLFDEVKNLRQSEMKQVANVANQPATVELNGVGEIKTMSDGTRYQVTPSGWRKLPVEESHD